MVVNKLYQSAINLRDMEDDFKIIPIPKLDENQQNYNSRIHDSLTIYGMPITAIGQEDAVSATLEAMASESYRLVTLAYYESALKVKFTRDSDSDRSSSDWGGTVCASSSVSDNRYGFRHQSDSDRSYAVCRKIGFSDACGSCEGFFSFVCFHLSQI